MTYDEYVKLRDSFGVTDYKVSKDTGIGRSTFSDWKNGRSVPKEQKIKILEQYFGIEEKTFPSFEPDHVELIRLYSKLKEEQKKQALQYLQFLALQD